MVRCLLFRFGGLDVLKPDDSGHTIMVNAAIIVSFDMEKDRAQERQREQANSGNGMGNDLYGQDYTKAARRAALRRDTSLITYPV